MSLSKASAKASESPMRCALQHARNACRWEESFSKWKADAVLQYGSRVGRIHRLVKSDRGTPRGEISRFDKNIDKCSIAFRGMTADVRMRFRSKQIIAECIIPGGYDIAGAHGEINLKNAERFVEAYRAGEAVFTEGSKGSEMFVVLSGRVEIVRSEAGCRTRLAELKSGEMFGEMALVDSGTRSASAIAVEDDTQVVRIDQARFVYLVSQQPAFALSVMRVMARRLAGRPLQIETETH